MRIELGIKFWSYYSFSTMLTEFLEFWFDTIRKGFTSFIHSCFKARLTFRQRVEGKASESAHALYDTNTNDKFYLLLYSIQIQSNSIKFFLNGNKIEFSTSKGMDLINSCLRKGKRIHSVQVFYLFTYWNKQRLEMNYAMISHFYSFYL